MPFNDIHSELEAARAGHNPAAIGRARSGWFVMASVQLLPGKCLLLPDPLVDSLNDLTEPDRTRFLSDMVGLGDALLRVTDAYRINYEILGNSDPLLHAHITPRYMSEPEHLRSGPAWLYDPTAARRFDLARDGALLNQLRHCLEELKLIVG